MQVMYSHKTDLWATPQDFFDALDREYHFDLDVCALPENAKCAEYYTPRDGRAGAGLYGAALLVQPALRPADRAVGGKGGQSQGIDGNVASGTDGYQVVSRFNLRQGHGDTFHKGPFEVRGVLEVRRSRVWW